MIVTTDDGSWKGEGGKRVEESRWLLLFVRRYLTFESQRELGEMMMLARVMSTGDNRLLND